MSEIKFALVPVETTLDMMDAGDVAANVINTGGHVSDAAIDAAYCAMLAASPGNDLLERIVRALHLGSTNLRNDGYIYASDGIEEILTELGAIAAAKPFTEKNHASS